MEQVLQRRGGAYARETATFRFDPGIGVTARVAAAALPPLFGCDGSRPFGELIAEGPSLAGAATEAGRTLIARGFMVAEPDAPRSECRFRPG